MGYQEEEDDWLAFVESEIEVWPELDQQVIVAVFGLRDGVRHTEQEVLRIFYRRGLTRGHLHELMANIGNKLRYRSHDGPIPQELPADYSKPASQSDRARFKILDELGVSLAEEVTGLPATFVSSNWDRHTWTSKGFQFDIEAIDSGGDVPVILDLDPGFAGQVMVFDQTDGGALTVFAIEFDEGANKFRVVGKPVDRERGTTVRLSAPPDQAATTDPADDQ